jgi:hypothetical protein
MGENTSCFCIDSKPIGRYRLREKLSLDGKKRQGTTLQAAEKLRRVGKSPEKRPSGAKASRLLSGICGTTKVVPFQNSASIFVFPQPVQPYPYKPLAYPRA